MILKTLILFLSLLFLGCIPTPMHSHLKFDPALKWQTIETAHFNIHFHQGEEPAAQKAAQIAEEAHALLVPRIGWEPKRKTELVLSDQEDVSNGMATPIPNNIIMVNLTPPPSSVIPFPERLEDWLRDVITHEYTHILQLDMAGGLPATIRALFGRYELPFGIFNSTFPNTLQPVWLIEGLATSEETLSGASDRANSAYAEMLLRMAILENQFPTIDQAAGNRVSWPGGEIPYLFGARFIDYLRQRFGDEAVKKISQNYSNNFFPLQVDDNAKETLGVSYVTLWDQWKTALTEKYAAKQTALKQIGLTTTEPLMNDGDINIGAQISSNGEILSTRINPREYPALHLIRPDKKDAFLTRRNFGLTASWSLDGKQIAFSQLENFKNYSLYSDLYLYDLKSQEVKRLTKGARLRDPDFHPNGTDLIAVQGDNGADHLILYHLDTNQYEVMELTNDPVMNLSHPKWSPDGKQVAVSGWKNGNQDIYLIDINAAADVPPKQIKPIHIDKALDLTPTWSPDGQTILFSSDRTGIYNLFAYELKTDTLFQVTHLLGGAFMPDISPTGDTIIFSSYSSRGFDLHSMPLNPSEWKRVDSDSPLEKAGTPAAGVEVPAADAPQKQEPMPLPAKPYSPWPTLKPRYWVPTKIGYSNIKGRILGIATGGADVLGKHAFNFEAFKNDQRLSFSLDYHNNVFWPSFYVGIFNHHNTYTHFSDDKSVEFLDYREKRQGLRLGVLFEQIFFQKYQSLLLEYRNSQAEAFEIASGIYPDDIENLGSLEVAWFYDSTQDYPFSISPEEGSFLSLRYRHFDQDFGSDDNFKIYDADLSRYDTFFKPNHVLAIELSGSLTDGNREFRDFSHTPRGYPEQLFVGSRTAFGTVAYRFPIQNIERGYKTWPFFFSKLHGEVFLDAGSTWYQGGHFSKSLKQGVGAELKLNMTFAYHVPIQFVFGFAQGRDLGGKKETYFDLGIGF
ncbi:MAG: hypothetical protein AAB035_04890 [Nitrospirota bacterium]